MKTTRDLEKLPNFVDWIGISFHCVLIQSLTLANSGLLCLLRPGISTVCISREKGESYCTEAAVTLNFKTLFRKGLLQNFYIL